MAKKNWEELHARFLAAYAESGISPQVWCEAQGLNYATAKRYIKKPIAKYNKNSPKTKRNRSNRRSGNPSPTSRFQPGNQRALKHGGYGRKLLLPDDVTEDALLLTLDDELFWLRASSLVAAGNIGRWRAASDDTHDDERRETLLGNIEAAEKAMHRNAARIGMLEFTKASIAKTQSQDEKLKFEIMQGSELLVLDIRKRTAESERLEQEIELRRKGNGKGDESTIIIKLVNSPDAD